MLDRYKYRICFGKDGAMRFIGHLDLLRLFQRALRRAGLPVAYSAGFNPHQLVSFAMPLPIGHSSAADYADIEFTCVPGDFTEALAAQLPRGLTVASARALYPGERAAAALTEAALYRITFPEGVELSERVQDLLDADSVVIEKKTKSGTAMADIRPDVIDARAEGHTIYTMLSAGSTRNLKPELLAGYLCGGAYTPFTIQYCRIDIYRKTAEGYESIK